MLKKIAAMNEDYKKL